MQGARQPQPGTTLGVTSLGQHRRAYGGPRVSRCPCNLGAAGQEPGAFPQGFLFGTAGSHQRHQLKDLQSCPAPEQPSSDPQSCPWSGTVLPRLSEQGAPELAHLPRGLCAPWSAGAHPPGAGSVHTYHFVMDGGRCWVVVRIHSCRDGPSITQIVVLRREEIPHPKTRDT